MECFLSRAFSRRVALRYSLVTFPPGRKAKRLATRLVRILSAQYAKITSVIHLLYKKANMATKLIAFRLDLDLIKAIEAEAEAKGCSKTDVVAIALRQAFGLAPNSESNFVLPNVAEAQALQIVEVQQQLNNLGETLSSVDAVIRGLTNRITILEQRFDEVSSRSSQSEAAHSNEIVSNVSSNALLDEKNSKHQQLSIEDVIAALDTPPEHPIASPGVVLYNKPYDTMLDGGPGETEQLEDSIAPPDPVTYNISYDTMLDGGPEETDQLEHTTAPPNELPYNKLYDRVLYGETGETEQPEHGIAPPDPVTYNIPYNIPYNIKLDKEELTQTQLAKRLLVESSTIFRQKNKDGFEEWSRTKDPDGLAWSYNKELKRFQSIKK